MAWVCPIPNHVLVPIDQGWACCLGSAMKGMVAFVVRGFLVLILVLMVAWVPQISGLMPIVQGQHHPVGPQQLQSQLHFWDREQEFHHSLECPDGLGELAP